MSKSNLPTRTYRTDLHQFAFRSNPRLTEIIKTMSNERHSSYSDTIRLLIGLGLKHYEINAKAGYTSGEKAQAARAVQTAQAESQAAIRQSRKQSDSTTTAALMPVLFADIDPVDND